ncbi:hypothetical protein RCL1_001468 [Eukaryota sp. TZLM3-RCL]
MNTLPLDQVEDILDSITEPTVFVFSEQWCPDCVEAAPIISDVACGYPSVKVYKVPVGDKQYWKSTNHELRVHPFWKLQKIPTLVAINASSNVMSRLVEGECLDRQKVDDAFKSL